MGHGYKIVNLDKEEYFTPKAFEEGYKLIESIYGNVSTALGFLLTQSRVFVIDGDRN